MCDQRVYADGRIAKVAERQHGVVSVEQLREAGLDKHRVRHRVRVGRLHPMHRGVYAVGHSAESAERRWMAAVLACGPGAVLSHMSAAVFLGLLRPAPGPVDVSVPTQGGHRRRSGIRLHRTTSLVAGMTIRHNDIPVTTPPRTISDLEGAVPQSWVRRAIRQAEMQGFRLGPEVNMGRTRSDLERDFLRLCRRHGLPIPEVNVKLGRWTVDFLWRRHGIAVETDFYGYHRGRIAFRMTTNAISSCDGTVSPSIASVNAR